MKLLRTPPVKFLSILASFALAAAPLLIAGPAVAADSRGVNPPGMSVKLFDYTVTGSVERDNIDLTQVGTNTRVLRMGINSDGTAAGRPFKFMRGNGNSKLPAGWSVSDPDVASSMTAINQYSPTEPTPARYWSASARPKLVDGYPYVDLQGVQTSLAYLFDDTKVEGKTPSKVKDAAAFQSDGDGSYSIGVQNTLIPYLDDGEWFLRKNQNVDPSWNFFPLNNTPTTYTSNTANHYFGSYWTSRFVQPRNGLTTDGDPMKFSFRGDDDVWVAIDDVIVMDLGGISGGVGNIDFSTGEIQWKTYQSSKNSNWRNTTIKQMFENAGMTPLGGFDGDTLGAGSEHTLKVFQLERGNYASSFRLQLNLQPIPITVHYEGNGATGGSVADIDTYKNTVIQHRANGFTRPGYMFSGWGAQPSGNVSLIQPGDSASYDRNVTLYAQWVPLPVSLPATGGGPVVPWLGAGTALVSVALAVGVLSIGLRRRA